MNFDESFCKVENINNDSELFEILELVYINYAGYTAWQLREKAHIAGGPWLVSVDIKGRVNLLIIQ